MSLLHALKIDNRNTKKTKKTLRTELCSLWVVVFFVLQQPGI